MKNELSGLQHIGHPAANFEKSLEFYKGLGFEPIALKYNLNGSDVAMVKNGDCVLEIYAPAKFDDRKEDASINHKWDHIALECASIESTFQECVAAGYEILSNGIEDADIWENGGKYFIISGLDGERIEFAQKF